MMDTRDLGIIMFVLLTGLPFALGFYLGWRAARFTWPGWSIRWPWKED